MNTLTRTSTLLVPALVVGTALTLGAAGGAEGRASEPLTFTLAPGSVSAKHLDIGRKGLSIGDRHLTSISLRAEGRVAGRLEIECLAIDARYGGQTCDVAAQLTDGTLFFEGVGFHKAVPGVGSGDDTVFAVTGGSGAYAGARGEVTVGRADRGPVTIDLSE